MGKTRWNRIEGPLTLERPERLPFQVVTMQIKAGNGTQTITVDHLTPTKGGPKGALSYDGKDEAGMDVCIQLYNGKWEMRWPAAELLQDTSKLADLPASRLSATTPAPASGLARNVLPERKWSWAVTDESLPGYCFLYGFVLVILCVMVTFGGSWSGATSLGRGAGLIEAVIGLMLLCNQIAVQPMVHLKMRSCLLVVACGVVTLMVGAFLAHT